LPVCHCERSWEGGKSRLASPETGLEAKGTGDAAGGASENEQPFSLCFLPAAFPEFDLPTGTLGNFQEHFK